MANSTGGYALTAKIHAMYGKRLTGEDYRELLHKQTVNEVASYIKQQTGYGSLMRDVNESLVHRGQLENILRRELFDQYTKIFHYINRVEMSFYRFFITRLEINEILRCIRYINAGRQDEFLFSIPSFFEKHARFDVYALAKAKTFDDIQRIIKDTPYYDAIRNFDFKAGEKIDTIKIEFEYNKLYYTKILRAIGKSFSGKTKTDVRNAFAMEIDLRNITDIIRFKKYFNMKGDSIRSLLLPFNFKIKPSQLNAILDAPDADSAFKAASDTFYGKYFTKFNFEFVDQYARQVMYNFHRNMIAFSTSPAVAVVSYLGLKQIEIENIVNIVEGIRYHVAPANISKLLVGAES